MQFVPLMLHKTRIGTKRKGNIRDGPPVIKVAVTILHSVQALMAEHSNLGALLALHFRDDIAAWAHKRAVRPAMLSVKPILSDANLKQVGQYNIRGCTERFKRVRPYAHPLNTNYPHPKPYSYNVKPVRSPMQHRSLVEHAVLPMRP